MIFKELFNKQDYPNARRVHLLSPELKMIAAANERDFEYAIGEMPDVFPAVVIDYVSNGQQRQIYDRLSRWRNPRLKENLGKIFASNMKDIVNLYVFRHKVSTEEMEPLLLESMGIVLKVQKNIPFESKLRKQFTRDAEKQVTELMKLLKELQGKL